MINYGTGESLDRLHLFEFAEFGAVSDTDLALMRSGLSSSNPAGLSAVYASILPVWQYKY